MRSWSRCPSPRRWRCSSSLRRRPDRDDDRTALSHGQLSSWAYVLRPVASREAPRADAPVVTIVRPETPERKPNLVQALTSRTDEVAGEWVRVRLAILPLGSTGGYRAERSAGCTSSAPTSSSTAAPDGRPLPERRGGLSFTGRRRAAAVADAERSSSTYGNCSRTSTTRSTGRSPSARARDRRR